MEFLDNLAISNPFKVSDIYEYFIETRDNSRASFFKKGYLMQPKSPKRLLRRPSQSLMGKGRISRCVEDHLQSHKYYMLDLKFPKSIEYLC